MTLPAYSIPTPTFRDPLQYPVGSRVGVTTAADVWEVGGAPTNAIEIISIDAYGPAGDTCTDGGFNAAAPRGAWSPNHWACLQCIIPLDGAPGVYPGVRVNPTTGDGYYLTNMIYTDDSSGRPFDFYLVRGSGGVATLLAQWSLTQEELVGVIGSAFQDRVYCLLEVEGSSVVNLRASILAPDQFMPMGALPGIIPDLAHTYVVGTYSDSTAQRVTTGRPGITGGGTRSTAAGAAFNFQAGTFAGLIDAASVDFSATARAPTVVAQRSQLVAAQPTDLVLQPRPPGIGRSMAGASASLSASSWNPSVAALGPAEQNFVPQPFELPLTPWRPAVVSSNQQSLVFPIDVWDGSTWVRRIVQT